MCIVILQYFYMFYISFELRLWFFFFSRFLNVMLPILVSRSMQQFSSCIVLFLSSLVLGIVHRSLANTDVWLRRNHHGQTTSAWLLHKDLKPAVWQTTKSLDRQTSNLVCSCLSGTVARGAIKVFDSWAFELIQCEQKFGLAGIIILLF